MKKTVKKDLENKIVGTLNQMLTEYNKVAAERIIKKIKSSGKQLAKRFNKELKRAEKVNQKTGKKKITGKNTVVDRKSRSKVK